MWVYEQSRGCGKGCSFFKYEKQLRSPWLKWASCVALNTRLTLSSTKWHGQQ